MPFVEEGWSYQKPPEGQILMEKRDARLFRADVTTNPTADHGWNIVALESRRQLRCKVQELIRRASGSNMTTDEIRQHLLLYMETYGKIFALHLVRSLQCDDAQERQSIVWLLTVLNDPETIEPLEQMAQNESLSRAIRLAASLALTGMGVPRDQYESSLKYCRRARLYAIS